MESGQTGDGAPGTDHTGIDADHYPLYKLPELWCRFAQNAPKRGFGIRLVRGIKSHRCIELRPGSSGLSFYVLEPSDCPEENVPPEIADEYQDMVFESMGPGPRRPGSRPWIISLTLRTLRLRGIPCGSGLAVDGSHLGSVYFTKASHLHGATLDRLLRMRRVDHVRIDVEVVDPRAFATALQGAYTRDPLVIHSSLVTLAPPDGQVDLDSAARPIPSVLPWYASSGLTCVYGKANAGKTTFLLDQLTALVARGRVSLLWIGADQPASLTAWAAAALRRYRLPPDAPNVSLVLPPGTLDLTGRGDGWRWVRGCIDRMRMRSPSHPVVVVIESLSAVLVGADENGAGTAGFLAEAAAAIRRTPDLSIIFTHHSNEKGLPRGHGSIMGNCEAVAQVAASGEARTVVTMKSKLHRTGALVAQFRLEIEAEGGAPRPVYEGDVDPLLADWVKRRPVATGPSVWTTAPAAVPPLDEEDAGYPTGLPEHLRPLWRELVARGGRDWFDEAVLGEANRAATPGSGENEKKRRSRHKQELLAGWVTATEAEGAAHYRLRVAPEAAGRPTEPSSSAG
jgi:hypothetical protein